MVPHPLSQPQTPVLQAFGRVVTVVTDVTGREWPAANLAPVSGL